MGSSRARSPVEIQVAFESGGGYDHKHQVERVLGSITIMGEQSFAGDISGGVTLISNEIIWPDGRPFRLAHLDRPSGLTPAIDPRMRQARLVRCDRRKFLVYDGGRAGE